MNREFTLNLDGMDLHAKMNFPKEKKDSYPLFIVVHGLTSNVDDGHIVKISDMLNEEGYITLRMDMYGHGQSEGSFKEHNLLLWVSEIVRAVEYVRTLDYVHEINLLGHSQGGAAVVLAGGILKEWLHCIIPMAAGTSLKHAYGNGRFVRMTFDPNDPPECVTFHDMPISITHLMIDRFLPFEETARATTNPVLLVHEDGDRTVPYACSEQLLEWYPNASLVCTHGDDHCFRDSTEAMLDAIRAFLKENH